MSLDAGRALIALCDDAIVACDARRDRDEEYAVGQWVVDECHALANERGLPLGVAVRVFRADLGL